jgi:hypothetical protein
VAMCVGDLRQRLIGHGDVVGSGVRVRVPRSQHPGQCLPGVVQPGEQRMIAISVLERRRSLLLLRMTGHQRGVHVDHQPGHHRPGAAERRKLPASFPTQQPRPFPSSSPGDLDPIKQGLVNRIEHPPRRRRGGHRPEQVRLVAEHGEITDRHPAVGEHHCKISQHAARRMRRATLPDTTNRAVERLHDPSCGGDIRQQP